MRIFGAARLQHRTRIAGCGQEIAGPLLPVGDAGFNTAITLYRVPRRRKGAGVLDGIGLPHAVLGHAVTLDCVQLRGVRRAEIVDQGLLRNPDRIDNQRVAFVMADRFSIPGRPRFLGMRHVQLDVTKLMIALGRSARHGWSCARAHTFCVMAV